MTRLEQLQKLARVAADDPLAHYGLALEYINQNAWAEAIAAFNRVLELSPAYSAAYYHRARCEIQCGQPDAARGTLRAGMEVAGAAGDWKTRNEMQELLDSIG